MLFVGVEFVKQQKKDENTVNRQTFSEAAG